MKWVIESIPHVLQEYDTLGDYRKSKFEEQCGPNYNIISVSDELNKDAQFLVAIHEMIESYICEKEGISWESIDVFDEKYEEDRCKGWNLSSSYKKSITNFSEPGDEPNAPYYKAHQFASAVERLIADRLGIDWADYEKHCTEVLTEVKHPNRKKYDA